MSRDRATSVIDLGLSKSLPRRRISHKISDPGPMFAHLKTGQPQTVKAERVRLISAGEIEEVPEPGGAAGCRRTILKIETKEHLKKVAVCHFANTLFYHIDQV